MDFNLGNFNSAGHCGKGARKYLYLMGGLALFILLATYIYEYHYLPGKQRQTGVVAANQLQAQAVQFAAPPASMGMNVIAANTPPAVNVAAPRVPPVIPASATPPGNHQADGRAQMVCSSCHQVTGANGAAVAFQNNPGMMLPVDNLPQQIPFARVVQDLKSSIVSISAMQTSMANQTNQPTDGKPHFANPFSGTSTESVGSGVIVSRNGYIVTNNHVVKNSAGLSVTVFTQLGPKRYRGDIVKLDETLDLALIKISPDEVLKPAPLGDSAQIQIADSVITIGSPFGLDQTVSRGIVSGLRRAVVIESITHDQLIQTDAAINQGNSGGAMVNRDGEVIGVNTAIYTPTGAFSGIGFAIPINKVKTFMQDTVKVDGQPLAGVAAMAPGGGMARNVAAPQGPPIRPNAPIPGNHKRDGRGKMACESCHQIIGGGRWQGQLMPAAFGFGVPPQNAGVTTGSLSPFGLPAAAQASAQINMQGALLEPLTPLLLSKINAQVTDGAFVASVYPNSAAERAGLQAGDIIFKIEGRWVLSPQEVATMMMNYKTGDNLRLSVYSGGQRRNLYLVLGGQGQ
jgi:serine protease Do